MRNVPALTWREINSAFFSPLAYVVLTLFLLVTGAFFCFFTYWRHEASISIAETANVIYFIFLVATPLLTMRLISEEYRSGTIETLMTAPVGDGEVILGKFFGALAFFVFMLLPTLIYVLILRALGNPDFGLVLGTYAGLLLMGCQFNALGLFCSALTRNQIVAGVMALVFLLILWVAGAISAGMGWPFGPILQYVGTLEHVRPFMVGRIAFRDAFYFVSTTCFWLFLAVRVLESKRWR